MDAGDLLSDLKLYGGKGNDELFGGHGHDELFGGEDQDHLKGKIFRVGHLGYVNDRDIITVVSAISSTLLELHKITVQQAGEALVKATKYLEEN